jgi:hypothetical protein
MLRTSFSAVPAFRRVEPAIISGPTSGVMAMAAARRRGQFLLEATPMVRAPRFLANLMAACDQGSNLCPGHAESWRAFRGVENGEASAGARANVNQAAATLQPGDDGVNGASNGWNFAGDVCGYFAVFAIHQLENFERVHSVEIAGRGVALFCRTPVEICGFSSLGGHRGIISAEWPPFGV